MENGFRQTVVFCFDASERLYFDVSHLLLLCTERGGQALEEGPPALCPGEHLLLRSDGGRAARAPPSTRGGGTLRWPSPPRSPSL